MRQHREVSDQIAKETVSFQGTVDTDVCRCHNGQSKKSRPYFVYSAVTALCHVEIQNYVEIVFVRSHTVRQISQCF